MDYELTAEREELRSTLRRMLAGRDDARRCYRSADSRVGEGPEQSHGRSLWSELASLGIAGIGIDERFGGGGGDLIDQSLVCEELGRVVAPAPFIGHVVAAWLIDMLGDAGDRERWLPQLADGATTGAVVLDVAAPGPPVVRARLGADGNWRLSGRVPIVFDASSASLLVVPATIEAAAMSDEDVRAFVVENVIAESLASIDRTRPVSALLLVDTRASLLRSGSDARADIERAWGRTAVLVSAEAAGAAAAVLEATSAYTLSREQFGCPIGTFQAVKQRLADMLVATENARSAALAGAWSLARSWPDSEIAISIAKSVATENAVRVVGDAIQLHGGIAITWEHDLHLFLRRVKTLELLFGEPSWHLERIFSALAARAVPPGAA